MATRFVNQEKVERKLARLAKLPPQSRSIISLALDNIAQIMNDSQRAYVPIGASGELHDSIRYFRGNIPEGEKFGIATNAGTGDPDFTRWLVAGSEKAFYARWVEFGRAPFTAGGKFAGANVPATPAQPFFFPGYRVNKKEAKRLMAKAMRDAVKAALQ